MDILRLFDGGCFSSSGSKGLENKGVKDISLGMYLLLVSGALSWIVYGFLVSDVPIIITNVAIFFVRVNSRDFQSVLRSINC